MRAPQDIVRIWQRFDEFPMETLTKAWWYQTCGGAPYQRSVEQMQEHRARLGCSGNCFDLALWLRREFELAGIRAHAVGHNLCTPDAHIAIIAFDRHDYGYFCDLGDQWLQPILIDPRVPAAQVSVTVENDEDMIIRYRRPNGKESRQRFDLRPISSEQLMKAFDHSQNLLRHRLVEVRRVQPTTGLKGHWEFSRGVCCWSLDTGLVLENQTSRLADRVRRIHEMTGMAPEVIATAFDVYRRLGTEMDWALRPLFSPNFRSEWPLSAFFDTSGDELVYKKMQ